MAADFTTIKLNLAYKIEGSNFVVRCPKHLDKNPSLKINKSTVQFICFGCNYKGNGNLATLYADLTNIPLKDCLTEVYADNYVNSSVYINDPKRITNTFDFSKIKGSLTLLNSSANPTETALA